MNFGHPEPTSQGQSLALKPIFLRANGGLHRANSSKLALQRASWQHWSANFSIDLPPSGEKKAVVSSAAEIMSYQNETVSLYKYLYIE